MDELKKWAESNKEEIDTHYSTHLDSLWEEIDRGLDMKSGHHRIGGNWLKWAAAILILVVAGGTYLGLKTDHSPVTLGNLSPELADTEIYYTTQLGEKLQILQSSGVEVDQQVYDDLEQLDRAYKDLMDDLQDNADNEEVVQAMIENYRLRLQILEQILHELNGNTNDQSDERAI